MQDGLIYEDIEKVLLARFPELWELVEREFGYYYDLMTEIPEAYPIFEDVLQGFILNLLKSDSESPELRRIFGFFEEMANSPDKNVTDLLGIAILERLVCKRDEVGHAWKYMGPKTRHLAREDARYRGCEENLPPGEASAGNGH